MVARVLAVATLALVATAAFATPAVAEDDDERITSYEIAYTVRANGTVHVVEDFSYDFGSTPNHGPERFIDTREPANDEDNRVYGVENVTATSPSGAPAVVSVEQTGDRTRIRIGDPDVTVGGTESYQLGYDLVGALNAQPDGTGELYWDAAGPDWRVPLSQITVTVSATGGISKQRCFFGHPGSTTPCSSATLVDGTATFSEGSVEPGDVLTVVAAFSLSSVEVPPPVLESRYAVVRAFQVTPVSVGGGAGLAVVGGGVLAIAFRRRRDRRYVDTIPGLTPAPGSLVREQPVSLLDPSGVVVRFEPPKGVSPAEAGVLLDRTIGTVHTTATMLDLAARGYLRISETKVTPKRQQPNRWDVALVGALDEGLRLHERAFLAKLFGTSTSVSLSKGGHSKRFLTAHQTMSKKLAITVVQRNWFPAMPAGGSYGGIAFAVFAGLVAVLVGASLLWRPGLGFVGLGLAVAVGCLVASLFVRSGRTAAGEAVAQQVLGFRHYLQVAEADRLRFEEGVDIFSRYLPWAVTFGIATEWAKVCHQLAQAGRIPASPAWYDSTRPWSYNQFSTNVGGLSGAWASNATMTFSGSGSSSSGSSGFSSNSSSGGGGGGGGGGSW